MKPRLLIILNRLVVGGPAVDVLPLANALQDKFTVHVLYGAREADEIEPSYLIEKYPAIQLVHIPALKRSVGLLNDIAALRAIKKYIRQFQPHIVHTHGAKSGLLGRYMAKKCGVPLVVHTFHGHLFHSYFNQFITSAIIRIEKKLLQYTDVVIAISETQQREIAQVLGKRVAEKIKLVPLGVNYIDDDLREHYRKAFRRAYQVKDDEVCVGMIGRMVRIKNPLKFIEIIAELKAKTNAANIRFFIIGDGEEIGGMKERLHQLNLPYSDGVSPAAIHFTSWVQNIQTVMEGLDIVVLTSLNEGTPLAIVEAQRCGKPVVAANVGGVKDTFVDGKTGFLVNDQAVTGYCDAIMLLAVDKDLRMQMGGAAIHFAKQYFSKEAEVDQLANIYFSYKYNTA